MEPVGGQPPPSVVVLPFVVAEGQRHGQQRRCRRQPSRDVRLPLALHPQARPPDVGLLVLIGRIGQPRPLAGPRAGRRRRGRLRDTADGGVGLFRRGAPTEAAGGGNACRPVFGSAALIAVVPGYLWRRAGPVS